MIWLMGIKFNVDYNGIYFCDCREFNQLWIHFVKNFTKMKMYGFENGLNGIRELVKV